jgi:hypothetical protein
MPEPTLQTDWNNEFNFWHKIISEEVERLRFNDGYEPIRIDLYDTGQTHGWAFVGKTRVGHVAFRAIGYWTYDSAGRKILRLAITKAP